ncbi:Endopolyphosphatase like protein [Verticillium longisporum]|uniref:Endopolyphosphatase like protein n=1 Tax=Verticillium longisporum TaxID=100787 RepID=A0A8I3ASM1_VERLO|nr:Endopolyphosphatase like protein [Verticillium longisporum]
MVLHPRPRSRLRYLALLALPLLHHGVAVTASPLDVDAQQKILGAPDGGTQDSGATTPHIQDESSAPSPASKPRKLRGKFLHITDLHPDDFYKAHTSTGEGYACHRSKGPAGYYGAETSDCDSPFTLVNATLEWIRENVVDDIDFVIWTGDTARHDSDEKIPRNQRQVLGATSHL